MITIKWLAGVIVLLSLQACTSLQIDLPSYDELLRQHTGQNGRACIRENDIRGYGVLADHVVSVNARGRNQYYLLTTTYQCSSLRVTGSAAFIGGYTELCGGGRDKIHTGEEACPVRGIFKFDSRQQAFAAFDSIKQQRNTLKQELKQQAKEKKAQAGD